MNQTAFHKNTPERVQAELEHCRLTRNLTRIWYGDVKAGETWLDTWDILGYVGRSGGSIQVPLMIDLDYSDGVAGPPLLDHCIIRIDTQTNPQRWLTLYQHPQFHIPDLHLISAFNKHNPDCHNAWFDEKKQEHVLFFDTVMNAWLWLAFQKGLIYTRAWLSQDERDEIKADARKPYNPDEEEEGNDA